MADAALRQILMLKRVPRAPRKITTKELQAYLREQEDMKVTERTIQRDLLALVEHLPLLCDDRNKPFGWSFSKDADLSIAAMDANTAITLDMVQRFLTKLMPSQALDSLRPQMEAAQKHLGQGMRGKTRWSDKVAMLPRGLPLIPAPVNLPVLEAVYTALLENRAMDVIRYSPDRPERIHPLGIVHRGPVIYLLCGFWDYPEVRQVALHRIQKVRVLDEPCKKPEKYTSLQDYITSGEFSYLVGDKPLKLKARFYHSAGNHLKETPLSEDQRITDDDDKGEFTLQATVADTYELRWWLQSFGMGVEVLAPASLRLEFVELAEGLRDAYLTDSSAR